MQLYADIGRGRRRRPRSADRKRACKVTAPPTNDPHLLPGESLAEALERQPREGDWRTTGIVWPQGAEVSLLAALGCGDWLLGVILEELSRDPRYEFCVVASTPGAATFYERHGFVRVGAIARYLDPEVDDVESTAAPAKPWQAYRHWAWGDERRESLRDNHGEPSYIMARRRPRVQPSQNPAPAPSYSSPDYFVPPPTSYQAPRSPPRTRSSTTPGGARRSA